MRTAVVLFTRDLRVHDHPALAAVCEEAEQVVPLFVFDEAALAKPIASPNKLAFLHGAAGDLAATMRDLGGMLAIRRGRLADEVAAVVAEVGAGAVFTSADVSAFAQRRARALREAIAPAELRECPGITVVPPGQLVTSGGGSYRVFTPYWRRWRDVERPQPLPAPTRIKIPPGVRAGRIPPLGDLTDGEPSPELPRGGEAAGRALLDRWLDGPVAGYGEAHDDLAADASSRLSPYLHLGCVSPVEVAARLDLRNAGAEAFLRQLCWRDFHHQVLADRPEASWEAGGPKATAGRSTTSGCKRGRTAAPAIRSSMPVCASSPARGGCTTVPG